MRLKIIIIEDEIIAIRRLKRLLKEMNEKYEILAEIKSIQQGKSWFLNNNAPNATLIFSDIQLLDGLSFEIFENITPQAPIIFTTAFDAYLLKAFKTYGIDYLLKPFSKEDLQKSIIKFKTLTHNNSTNNVDFNVMLKEWGTNLEQSKFPIFISYVKDKFIPIKSQEIAYFSLQYNAVFAVTERRKWLLVESLNQIQEKLPAQHFYRANRQIIIQKNYIKEIQNHFNYRLKIILSIAHHEEILISKDNVKDFKNWLQK